MNDGKYRSTFWFNSDCFHYKIKRTVQLKLKSKICLSWSLGKEKTILWYGNGHNEENVENAFVIVKLVLA